PRVSEPEIAQHFARLAAENFNVDANFYPLGSCTMKYNPKVHESIASDAGWARLHPEMPEEAAQGAMRLMHELESWLAAILGMDAVSLQPPAGAAGEFTSLRVFRAYHDSRGSARSRVIVPDTAHGTNPASVARCGYTVTALESGDDGRVDLAELENALGDDVAAMMLTNPNTLGLFESDVLEIARLVHEAGALLYCDGANLNAIMGYARPGDMGFDAVQVNLHKTFSTPHGGGGPGSGPVAVTAELERFLPVPRLAECEDGSLAWDWDRPESIGKVQAFYGNFLVAVRAWAYILSMGAEGLRTVSEDAVLNANYVMHMLQDEWDLPYPGPCMHECVLSARTLLRETGVRAADVAKRLLDYDIHPPTMYFPIIVDEALMIEPTETESRSALERFTAVMLQIAHEAREHPERLHDAPQRTPVRRVDEVKAAREPTLRWRAVE
ncbi:MAG: aminomethyl-transferring glycine dehydrogenase subunit GcvPB, partial [Armatimonadota bacterium]